MIIKFDIRFSSWCKGRLFGEKLQGVRGIWKGKGWNFFGGLEMRGRIWGVLSGVLFYWEFCFIGRTVLLIGCFIGSFALLGGLNNARPAATAMLFHAKE